MSVHLPSSQVIQKKTMLFNSGEVVVRAGESPAGVLTLLRGKLKRKRAYPSGLFLIGIASPGDRLGLFESVHNRHHLETLEAIGEVEIAFEPLDLIQRRSAGESIVNPNTGGLRGFGDWLLQDADSRFRLRRPLHLLPVRSRVAATIWILQAVYGDETPEGRLLNLELTREEIAHLSSTVYESVIRTLTKLKNDGIVRVEGRKLWILDDVRLAKTAQIELGAETDAKHDAKKTFV